MNSGGGISSSSSTIVHEGLKVQPRRPLSRYLTSNHTLQGKLNIKILILFVYIRF